MSTAVRMGVLRRNADGSYQETGVKSENITMSSNDPLPADKQVESVELMDPEIRDWFKASDRLKGSEYTNSLISRIIAHTALGEGKGNATPVINELANDLKCEPEQAHQFADMVLNDVWDRTASHITKNHRIDGSEVLNWAGENLKASTKANLMQRLFLSDASAVGELLHRYNYKETCLY